MNPLHYTHHLMSDHYYPEPQAQGIITQLIPEEQGAAEAEKLVKGRRRRRKSKGGEGGELMRKRKLSEEQLSMLERSFGSEHKLESERKERLAAELGLDPRQVAVWFQNRRARWKAKKMEEEYATLRSHLDSTILEKCRLEAQVVKMKEELNEAVKEIERLMWEGLRSNSPASSSLSMEEPHFVGDNNVYAFQWDDHIYYM